MIWTKHEFKDEFNYYKVLRAFPLKVDKYFEVTTFSGKLIKCSVDHLFMTVYGKMLVSEMTIDDKLLMLVDNEFEYESIVDIKLISAEEFVYKLEIEDAHTYIGENGIWHHNKAELPEFVE